MSEVTTPEKPVGKEEPSLSAFDQIQAFLKERGQFVNHHIPGTNVEVQKLQYQRSDVWFLSYFSFPDLPPQNELTKNIIDLTISQKQVASPDSPSSDIELTLAYKGQLKLGKIAEGKPQDPKQISRVKVINPQSGKKERAIIEPFNPLGRWLDLSKDNWQEIREEHGSHWVTTSEQEAKKVVNQLMIPEEMHRVGRRITNEPKISRRGFLALMGVGAKAVVLDSLLSHIPGAPSLSKTFWEQVETATLGIPTEELKKEIEKKFQVEVVGPNEGVTEVEYSEGKRHQTVDWDNPRLKGLIRALSELPSQLYLPQKIQGREQKIRFALVDLPKEERVTGEAHNWIGYCACHEAQNQLAVVDKKYLSETFFTKEEARRIWFHEITHAFTTPYLDYFLRVVMEVEPIGIDEEGLRSLFASEFSLKDQDSQVTVTVIPKNGIGSFKVSWPPDQYIIDEKNRVVVRRQDYIMEGKEFLYQALKDYLKVKQNESDNSSQLGQGEFWYVSRNLPKITHKSQLGYGMKNCAEFLAVAAEYYGQGRDNFIKTYERFLGRERAEKLYEGVKRGIFQQKEY